MLALLLAVDVTLAWDPVVPSDSYMLYVDILPITTQSVPLQGYPTTDTFFTISGLTYGTTYYFAATSMLGGFESDYSNEVQYTPLPTPTPLPSPSPSPTPVSSPTPRQGWWRHHPSPTP